MVECLLSMYEPPNSIISNHMGADRQRQREKGKEGEEHRVLREA